MDFSSIPFIHLKILESGTHRKTDSPKPAATFQSRNTATETKGHVNWSGLAGASGTGLLVWLGQRGHSFLCVSTSKSNLPTPHLLEHPTQYTFYFGLVWQIFLSGWAMIRCLVAGFHVSVSFWGALGKLWAGMWPNHLCTCTCELGQWSEDNFMWRVWDRGMFQ